MRSRIALLLAAVVVASCQCDGQDGDAKAPARASASAAPTAAAAASQPYDPPPPGEGWIPADPESAKGMTCSFFGARSAAACEELRPIATWQKGERGRIRFFQAIVFASGAPRPIKHWKFYGKVTQLEGSMSLMELQQATTIQYWVVSGSRVLEAEGDVEDASLRETFIAWARRVVEETRGTP